MKSFLAHASVYGLANLLLQVGQFLLLPLYLRCLSPAEYGLLELATRCAETAGTLLLFGGFRQALMTHYQQAEDDQARRRVVCSALLLYAVAALTGGALALVLAPRLAGQLGDTSLSPFLLQLALLLVLLEPFCFVPQTLQQARVQSVTYVVAALGHFAVRVGLCIGLVRFFDAGVAGVLAGNLIAAGLFGLFLTARELALGLAWPDRAVMRGLLAFALPMLPGGLCFFLLHQGDRLFLMHHAGAAEVGTYALGYNLAFTVGRFSFIPLFMVWSARMYEAVRRDDAPTAFGEAFRRILSAYAFAGLGVCLFAPEIVGVLGGEAYAPAALYVAPVFLACLVQGAATLLDAPFYIQRRTGLKLALTLAATAVMLGLYALLIPRHGAMGAALATVGGFAFLALATWLVTRRLFPVTHDGLRLAGVLALVSGLWLLSGLAPDGPWGLAFRAGLWLLAPPLAWVGGLFTPADRRAVLDLVRPVRARVWCPGRAASVAGGPAEAAPSSSCSWIACSQGERAR